MAIVFISPKKRQRMFFVGITVMLLLFLAVISLIVFLSEPKEVAKTLVFNKTKINIDMSIFDSEQFKNLQEFNEIETQYSYKAQTKDKIEKSGFVSATSMDAARDILIKRGLTVNELKEVEIGRDNPFTPYYTSSVKVNPGVTE